LRLSLGLVILRIPENALISRFVEQALRRAQYQPVDSGYCATVPALRGVVALGRTLEDCRAELAEVVEEWILVRVARGLAIPKLGGVLIRVKRDS
jgi:predicted RNase H-like HicB family nuclease